MARAKKEKKCLNVGALKEFLHDIPDKTPIRGGFDDRVVFFLWKRDNDESGPKTWLGMGEE